MTNDFDTLLQRLSDEVLSLKTPGQKSVGGIDMVAQTIDVHMPMQADNPGIAYASKWYKVTPTNSAQPLLFTATIDKPYESDDGRLYSVAPYWQRSDNSDIILVHIDGSTDDWQAIIDGGSININLKLTIVATDDFTITEYNA